MKTKFLTSLKNAITFKSISLGMCVSGFVFIAMTAIIMLSIGDYIRLSMCVAAIIVIVYFLLQIKNLNKLL